MRINGGLVFLLRALTYYFKYRDFFYFGFKGTVTWEALS